MTPATPPRAGRRRGGVAKLIVTAAIFAMLASSCLAGQQTKAYTSQQKRVAGLVNKSRANNGVNKVKKNKQLARKAQSWAEYLSRLGRLKHSKLSKGITLKWKSLGENVGYGGSIRGVHGAYMQSPGHRANILDRKFNYIGTGFAKKKGRVYTVQVFMKR